MPSDRMRPPFHCECPTDGPLVYCSVGETPDDPPSDRMQPPFHSIADRIRYEADVAARPGQYVRLMAIAEELDERAICDTECDHRPMCPMWEP